MAQNFWYPPGSSSASSLTANQGTPGSLANAWPVKITDGTDLALVNTNGSLNVEGPLTDTQLRAGAVPVSVASLPLPSGSATAAKQATSDINVTYDYRALTYVGATQKVNTIVYKTGGSGGTTVATQTFGYDGSDRVTSITTTY